MQYDGGGGGTFITLKTVNNGIFDAGEISLNRAERQERAQADCLLVSAALVQPLCWQDVESPVIKHQRVGFLTLRLGVVAEDVQVRLPFQLPVVAERRVPGSGGADTERDAGGFVLLPRLEVGGALDLDPHLISGFGSADPVIREGDVVGAPVHLRA